MIKNYIKLKRLCLDSEYNSIMEYITKNNLLRRVIKEELNFEERKFLEFIQVSVEIS